MLSDLYSNSDDCDSKSGSDEYYEQDEYNEDDDENNSDGSGYYEEESKHGSSIVRVKMMIVTQRFGFWTIYVKQLIVFFLNMLY